MQTCVLIFDKIMNERVLLLRYLYLKEPFKYCVAEKTNRGVGGGGIPNFTKTISAVPKLIFPLPNVAYSLQHACVCNIEFPLVQLLKGGKETKKPVKGLSKPGRQLAHHCNWLAHHQGSLPTTRALSLPALAPCYLLRHTATNTKDKYSNIHGFKYTNIQGFKYTNIQGFKYTNTNTTMVALASIVSVSLVVLAKLTLQNIILFFNQDSLGFFSY